MEGVLVYLSTQSQSSWVGTKVVKKKLSTLNRLNIYTALPRMVPVYTCSSSVISSSVVFSPSKVSQFGQ